MMESILWHMVTKTLLIKLGEIKLLLIRNSRVVKLLIRSIIFDEK